MIEIGARDARLNFSLLLKDINYRKQPVIITRRNKKVAVLISFEDYKELTNVANRRRNKGI